MDPWHVLSTEDRERDFKDGLLMIHRCRIIVYSFLRPCQWRTRSTWLGKSGKCCETICYQDQWYDREIYLYDAVNSNIRIHVPPCTLSYDDFPSDSFKRWTYFRENDTRDILKKNSLYHNTLPHTRDIILFVRNWCWSIFERFLYATMRTFLYSSDICSDPERYRMIHTFLLYRKSLKIYATPTRENSRFRVRPGAVSLLIEKTFNRMVTKGNIKFIECFTIT